MQRKIEVYFDFTCPYCYKGLKEFEDILKEQSDVDVVWYPCEAHPRPEFAKVHSDLAAQAMIFLQERGLDTKKFKDLVFHAHFEDALRIDDIDLLSAFAKESGADEIEVKELLAANRYADKVVANNQKVWADLALDAVPSYILDGKIAASKYLNLVTVDTIRALF